MIIDGKAISQLLLSDLAKRVHALQHDHNITPHLAVLRLGNDPAISSYVAQKEKMAKEIGAYVSVYNYPVNSTEKQLRDAIHFLQTKGDIHGLIVQLPLPSHLHEENLLKEINPTMDVDGFKESSPFIVPLASAVLYILEVVYEKITDEKEDTFMKWLANKFIVVIGKGKTGGQPIINLFQKFGIHPHTVDSKTKNPQILTSQADIIISAVGKKGVITSESVKKDVVLIGIGMGKDTDGKFYGDYETDDMKDKASFYTPIPGGVGPVNVAKLMENLVIAAEKSVGAD